MGGWRTQTFIAGLRHCEMIAPWVLDGPMNKEAFEAYVETQLAPALPGDVVILDNLSSHKSAKAAQTLKAAGCWFLRGGRSQIRNILYMAALSAMRFNPDMKVFADRLKEKGKPGKQIVIAVARKLIELVNVILKRGTPWQNKLS